MSARLPGIGSHHSARRITDEWYTPPEILAALGPFDLDPCAPPDHPDWTGAAASYTITDDGLTQPWHGTVWLNPPYSDVAPWMARLAEHGDGIARCETRWWFEHVWPHATALLFLAGRVTFYKPDGTSSKAGHNSGGPSVAIAYGAKCADRLALCGLPGALVDRAQLIGEAS